jgi:hypothetical protein
VRDFPFAIAHLGERKKHAMSPPFGSPDWGIFFLSVPFLCALPVGILRLDVHLARLHRRRTIAPGMGIDDRGHEFFTDPDGRRWYPARRVK